MGLLTDLAQLINSDWGWVIPLLWLAWQAFASKHVPHYKPMLAGLFRVDERLDRIGTLEDNQSEILETINGLDHKQEMHIQVTRAHSRALDDDKNVSVTSDEVDKYLVKNGVPVETFLDTSLDKNGDSENTHEYFERMENEANSEDD